MYTVITLREIQNTRQIPGEMPSNLGTYLLRRNIASELEPGHHYSCARGHTFHPQHFVALQRPMSQRSFPLASRVIARAVSVNICTASEPAHGMGRH